MQKIIITATNTDTQEQRQTHLLAMMKRYSLSFNQLLCYIATQKTGTLTNNDTQLMEHVTFQGPDDRRAVRIWKMECGRCVPRYKWEKLV